MVCLGRSIIMAFTGLIVSSLCLGEMASCVVRVMTTFGVPGLTLMAGTGTGGGPMGSPTCNLAGWM